MLGPALLLLEMLALELVLLSRLVLVQHAPVRIEVVYGAVSEFLTLGVLVLFPLWLEDLASASRCVEETTGKWLIRRRGH